MNYYLVYRCLRCGDEVNPLNLYNAECVTCTKFTPYTMTVAGPTTCDGDLNVTNERVYGEVKDTRSCSHSWAPYTGLWKTYDYCTLCDVKKETT